MVDIRANTHFTDSVEPNFPANWGFWSEPHMKNNAEINATENIHRILSGSSYWSCSHSAPLHTSEPTRTSPADRPMVAVNAIKWYIILILKTTCAPSFGFSRIWNECYDGSCAIYDVQCVCLIPWAVDFKIMDENRKHFRCKRYH